MPEISALFTANLNFLKDKFDLQIPKELISSLSGSHDHSLSENSIAEFNRTKSSFAKVTCPFPPVNIKPDIQFPDFDYDNLHESTSNDFEAPFKEYALSKLYPFCADLPQTNSSESYISSIILVGIKSPFFMVVFVDWCIENNIRNVAFIDCSITALVSSCFIVDWPKLFNKFLDHDIKSSFFLEGSIADSLSASVNWLSSISYYSAVNFYYYIDRIACPEYIEAAVLLSDPSAYFSFTAKGFFEDNMNMLHNSIKTLSSSEVKFIDFSLIQSIDCPVILVGSSPSLDQNLHEIRSLQQLGCCVISCGSSITTLFEADIIPDFAVLVERNASVYYKHKSAHAYHSSFAKVHLIAASTVDSRIFPYYEQVSIYTRSSNVLASVTNKTNLLSHTHTTSSNAGLSFALSLLPSSLYLYGLDFGSLSRSKSRSLTAHGVGSYSLDKVVRGAKQSIFTCSSLLRSFGLFDQLLSSSSYNSPIFSRSIARFNSKVQHIDSLDNILVPNPFSKNYTLPSFDVLPCDNYHLDKYNLIEFLSEVRSSSFVNVYQCPVTDISISLLSRFRSSTDLKIISCLVKSLSIVFSSYYQFTIKSSGLNSSTDKQILQMSFRNSFVDSLISLLNYIDKLYLPMIQYLPSKESHE